MALAVKSIAVQRGWQHSRHDLLYAISDQIADELDRPDLDRLFRSASSLHTNFYEDWMTEGNVRGGINDAKAYLREMERCESHRRQHSYPKRRRKSPG